MQKIKQSQGKYAKSSKICGTKDQEEGRKIETENVLKT